LTNGTISGIVFDSDRKAIPGAGILIVNDATGISYPGQAPPWSLSGASIAILKPMISERIDGHQAPSARSVILWSMRFHDFVR
jgi:hypothetical protein